MFYIQSWKQYFSLLCVPLTINQIMFNCFKYHTKITLTSFMLIYIYFKFIKIQLTLLLLLLLVIGVQSAKIISPGCIIFQCSKGGAISVASDGCIMHLSLIRIKSQKFRQNNLSKVHEQVMRIITIIKLFISCAV